VERSGGAGEAHQEAYCVLFFVDARSGNLELFDFGAEKGVSKDASVAALKRAVQSRTASYADRISKSRAEAIKSNSDAVQSSPDQIENIPEADSTRSAGFVPPQFLNRVKPEYTTQADLADVTATVEASAVFKASGEVGDVVITRWAGYGLDEASLRAIAQLKFKPATRDGKPINVRATVQYNFRRLDQKKP